MDYLIKLLDENLEYINHEVIKDTIYINVKSSKEEICCPDCKTPSKRIHSRYHRRFQDLLSQGKNQL